MNLDKHTLSEASPEAHEVEIPKEGTFWAWTKRCKGFVQLCRVPLIMEGGKRGVAARCHKWLAYDDAHKQFQFPHDAMRRILVPKGESTLVVRELDNFYWAQKRWIRYVKLGLVKRIRDMDEADRSRAESLGYEFVRGKEFLHAPV